MRKPSAGPVCREQTCDENRECEQVVEGEPPQGVWILDDSSDRACGQADKDGQENLKPSDSARGAQPPRAGTIKQTCNSGRAEQLVRDLAVALLPHPEI